jgi:CTP:molybdopterin cytidylyltransferase MocA
MGLRGDRGGKSVLLKNSRQIKIVPVKSEGVVEDIDTWKAYQRALKMRRGRDERNDSAKAGKRTR